MTKTTWLNMQCWHPEVDGANDFDFRTRPFKLRVGKQTFICATDRYGLLAVEFEPPKGLKLNTIKPKREEAVAQLFRRKLPHSRVANLAKLKRWAGKIGPINGERAGELHGFDVSFDKALLARTLAGAEDKTVKIRWDDNRLHFVRIDGKDWCAFFMPRNCKGNSKPFSGWIDCGVMGTSVRSAEGR